MVTFTGATFAPAQSDGPANTFGGSATFAETTAQPNGAINGLSGDTWPTVPFVEVTSSSLAWLLQLSGDNLTARNLAPVVVPFTGFLDHLTGSIFTGRAFAISAVYRNSDRITIAGYALDLAGKPLRQYQIQFVGQTVQAHYFGSATDLDGIYVAYLETGDDYTAYAFDTKRGLTYRLEQMVTLPNQTNLVFRLVTKRGGFGEGIFLQGG